MSAGISLTGLVKGFPAVGGAPATRAVDGVSLDIETGELFFLLGPSGCGKTTLLRLIAGFVEPEAGLIRFGGRDVTSLPPNKRNAGMVFQSYALWPHMTVEANVGFGLSVRRVPAAERARRVREALAAVRMETHAARKPNQLSGGQQQRVALARALVIRPDVLLLDEPLSNLDAKLRIELRSEIRRICKEAGPDGRALTTVYVTHDQKEALSMADRVAIMDRGRVVQVGPPQELYRRPRSRFVAEFLGETNLVRATAGQRTPSGLELATLAGPLLAASDGPPAPGSPLLCSIRPEAVSLQPRPGASSLAGRVVESVYLGEIIQHTVELRGGQRLLAVELNPGATAWSRGGTDVTVSVFPQDVVILAEP